LTSRWVLAGLALLLTTGLSAAAAEEEKGAWTPPPPAPDRFDWVQLTNGEWLKGEIIVLYDGELEFDSDELDLQTFDLDDVQHIRSAGTMQVGTVGGEVVVGRIVVDGDTIRVIGEEGEAIVTRAQLLSITAGEPREINRWSAKIGAGATLRSGNTESTDLNLSADIRRRTVRNRLVLTYLGNQSTTFSETTANSHRGSFVWDRFITQHFFVNPVFVEYFRDPFQNIDRRGTVGFGAGYQLVDTKKVALEVAGGPAYQKTWFVEVEPGESETETTPALVVSTMLETEPTGWLDFDWEYRFQWVNKKSGTYNHHMVFNFETEITSRLDFDVKFVWDYIQDPRADAEGVVPERTDFWTIIGLSWDF
jgi:putative salt-induced outer membrane protein YdiY